MWKTEQASFAFFTQDLKKSYIKSKLNFSVRDVRSRPIYSFYTVHFHLFSAKSFQSAASLLQHGTLF